MPDIPTETPPYAQIAPRLRGLRVALNLSVEEMAARVESTPDKVALYESGTVEIPVSHLFHAAKNHVKSLTAPYKYPRIIDYVDELPKTISGKIKRAEIRATDLRAAGGAS